MRTRFKIAEAVREGGLKPIKIEVSAATLIGAIDEWTRVGHRMGAQAPRFIYRQGQHHFTNRARSYPRRRVLLISPSAATPTTHIIPGSGTAEPIKSPSTPTFAAKSATN